jgi:hypothetical protein
MGEWEMVRSGKGQPAGEAASAVTAAAAMPKQAPPPAVPEQALPPSSSVLSGIKERGGIGGQLYPQTVQEVTHLCLFSMLCKQSMHGASGHPSSEQHCLLFSRLCCYACLAEEALCIHCACMRMMAAHSGCRLPYPCRAFPGPYSWLMRAWCAAVTRRA